MNRERRRKLKLRHKHIKYERSSDLVVNLNYPKTAESLFTNKLPYAVLYGGRGSGKSQTVARYCLYRAMRGKVNILCLRESQNSLDDSVHALLSGLIYGLKLTSIFEIQKNTIINRLNGSKIIFKGMRQDAAHLRSLHNIGIVWIEEGQFVGAPGFISLDDTVREDGAKIIMVLNPRFADDHIYKEFVATNRNDTLKINLNITENPYATKMSRAKAARLRETNFRAFQTIYLGLLEEGGETIGAFRKVEKFTSDYLVAFIDTSFSDRNDTDRTSCSIVGLSISEIDDIKQCPIEFTGKSWQKSITNEETIRELIAFLDKYLPIESCIEANLGGDGLASTFIDRFKLEEINQGIQTKNTWTTFHQTKNKHERIMHNVGANKSRIFVLADTDSEYLNPIINYSKRIEHDDEIDSLAGAINLWLTSDNLRNYIYQYEQLRKQRII